MRIKAKLTEHARRSKVVVLEVPDDFWTWYDEKQHDLLGAVYDADCERTGVADFEDDEIVSGPHLLRGQANDSEEADYRVRLGIEDGEEVFFVVGGDEVDVAQLDGLLETLRKHVAEERLEITFDPTGLLASLESALGIKKGALRGECYRGAGRRF